MVSWYFEYLIQCFSLRLMFWSMFRKFINIITQQIWQSQLNHHDSPIWILHNYWSHPGKDVMVTFTSWTCGVVENTGRHVKNQELKSIMVNKGRNHRELRYFLGILQIRSKLDRDLRLEIRYFGVLIKRTSRQIHKIKNHSIWIKIREEIKERN